VPSAIWTGSLSLGMVVVPVRLYPAVRKRAIRFHELDARGRRVRHVRVAEALPEPDLEWTSPPEGPRLPMRVAESRRGPAIETAKQMEAPPAPQVAFDEIRKGYEVAAGQYVSLSREEVASLAPERSRAIDVQQFVDVSAVDPVYFEARYYVVPDREAAAPFRVLREAMAAANRMALAWFTLRSRRYLAAVRAFGDVMLLTTMVHSDEIVPAQSVAPHVEREPTERELKMARLLIDTLSGPFEPERYPDEHRRSVMEAIEARTPAAAEPSPAPSPTRVIDLMAALEASVKAAREARATENRQSNPRRRGSTA
jgi:DNA end-binding protein Ku